MKTMILLAGLILVGCGQGNLSPVEVSDTDTLSAPGAYIQVVDGNIHIDMRHYAILMINEWSIVLNGDEYLYNNYLKTSIIYVGGIDTTMAHEIEITGHKRETRTSKFRLYYQSGQWFSSKIRYQF